MMNEIIILFQMVWVALFLGFWVSFFLGDNKSKMSEVEYKHELSFPFPDLGWITPTLIIAAIGLLSEQKYGYFFSALAGSGMIFLGIIDLAFNIQNGKFNRKKYGFDALVSMGVVILTLIFGPIFIIYGAVGLEVI